MADDPKHQRARDSASRANTAINIIRLLGGYGFDIRDDGGDREQQFSCDMHGDGHDNKPSARVYPDSNSWYCFACSKSRDAIQTVREREGLSFWDAVRKLEKAAGLQPLPDDYTGTPEVTLAEGIVASLRRDKTFADDCSMFDSLLSGITEDRQLAMDVVLPFWEAFDGLVYKVDKEEVPEHKARVALEKLRLKVLALLKEQRA